MTADRVLFVLLRANAVVLLCAAPCALLPFAWMDAVGHSLSKTERAVLRYLIMQEPAWMTSESVSALPHT